MNSFNTLDEIPATGHKHIQREILKGDWNFDGFIVSDWGSIDQMIPHGFASDGEHAAELAVIAGSDMDMESSLYVSKLAGLVESGKVNEELLDDAVRRILRVKYELGLFEDPFKYCNQERSDSELGAEENMQVALEAAKKSIVLLKNDNLLLPLKKQNQKIAIIGQLANDKNSTLGNWRSQVENNSAVSVVEGMKKYNGNKTIYEKGVELYYGKTNFHNRVKLNYNDRSDFGKAKLAAASSDIVIMVLGEEGHQSGEGRSRTNIDLPGLQKELLKEIKILITLFYYIIFEGGWNINNIGGSKFINEFIHFTFKVYEYGIWNYILIHSARFETNEYSDDLELEASNKNIIMMMFAEIHVIKEGLYPSVKNPPLGYIPHLHDTHDNDIYDWGWKHNHISNSIRVLVQQFYKVFTMVKTTIINMEKLAEYKLYRESITVEEKLTDLMERAKEVGVDEDALDKAVRRGQDVKDIIPSVVSLIMEKLEENILYGKDHTIDYLKV